MKEFNANLGYNVSDVTHHSVGFVMDFMLLVFFVILWKPLSILLIYVELLLKIFIAVSGLLISEGPIITPYFTSSLLLFSPHLELCFTFAIVMMITKFALFGPSNQSRRSLAVFANCFLCLFSLSLFLRFFSFYPSAIQLRKHHRLQRVSIIYRFLHHIM